MKMLREFNRSSPHSNLFFHYLFAKIMYFFVWS